MTPDFGEEIGCRGTQAAKSPRQRGPHHEANPIECGKLATLRIVMQLCCVVQQPGLSGELRLTEIASPSRFHGAASPDVALSHPLPPDCSFHQLSGMFISSSFEQ
jgi:hypothetical protein